MFYTKGFALIIVMLFLSILSLLAFSVLEVSLLENKMSVFYKNKIESFYLAEKHLLQAEQQIQDAKNPTNDNIRFRIINTDICKGAIVYHLIATADYRAARSVLHSTFIKVHDISQCDLGLSGRQSFWVEV